MNSAANHISHQVTVFSGARDGLSRVQIFGAEKNS